MIHPVLDQINELAAEWHDCMVQASDGRWRRKMLLDRAAQLEERLDWLWYRHRRSLAVAHKDRFASTGERIYYTTPQHK